MAAGTVHLDKAIGRFNAQAVGPETALACGICGATVEGPASPLYPPPDAPIEIRSHVLEAHQVSVEALEESVRIEATRTLADGRVWMRGARSEGYSSSPSG